MIYDCPDEALAPLDAMEAACGYGYNRITIEAITGGEKLSTFTYVGMPEFLNDSCLPTKRYFNRAGGILIAYDALQNWLAPDEFFS